MDFVNSYVFCVLSLTRVGSSLCAETRLGDQFQILNLTIGRPIRSMVPDLAIPGNVLLWFKSAKLLTTNMTSFTKRNTASELNMTTMPPFSQTATGDFVYALYKDNNHHYMGRELCICHLGRSSKKITSMLGRPCELEGQSLCQIAQYHYPISSRRHILVNFDERYKEVVYVVSARAQPIQVIFLDLHTNPYYKNRFRMGQNFSDDILNHADDSSSYYTIRLPALHISSAAQNGDYTYLLSDNNVYRMEMPSASIMQPGGDTQLATAWISGGESQYYMDGDFARAKYSKMKDIDRINSTMLAITDRDRIRLLDLRTNITSSLCLTGAYNAETGSTPSTCALKGANTLMFMNNNLYINWRLSFGRIYRIPDTILSAQVEKKARNSYDMKTIIAVSASIPLLATVISVSIFMWRRKSGSFRIRHRAVPEIRPNSGMVSRPLPSISATLELQVEVESYEMPELQREDVYDMIGDQYYQTIHPRSDYLTTNEPSMDGTDMDVSHVSQNTPESGDYVDRLNSDHRYSPKIQKKDACDSNLDGYGYLKPNTVITK